MFDNVNPLGLDTSEALDAASVTSIVAELYSNSVGLCSERSSRRQCFAQVEQYFQRHHILICKTVLRQINKYSQLDDRSTDPAQSLISLEWIALCVKGARPEDGDIRAELTLAEAFLVASCFRDGTRSGVQSAALKRIRYSISRALQAATDRSKVYLENIVLLTGPKSNARTSIYLSEILTAMLQDANVHLDMNKVREVVLIYFLEHFVLSKTKVSKVLCESLAVYLESVLTEQELELRLLPALLKALLRTPEQIVDPVLTTIIRHSCPQSDQSTRTLSTQLTQPIINLSASSSVLTRDGALRAIESLAVRCPEHAKDIGNQLSRSWTSDRPGVEQRIFLARAFQSLGITDPTIRTEHTLRLLDLLSKESNELVQSTLVESILQIIRMTSMTMSSETILLDTIKKGIVDKKVKIRNSWLCGLGFLTKDNPELAYQIVNALLPDLLRAWTREVSSPLQTIQAGSLSGVLALTVVFMRGADASSDIGERLLADNFRSQIYSAQQPFVCFSERIVSKVSRGPDLEWMVILLKEILDRAMLPEWRNIAENWCKVCLKLPLTDRDRRGLCIAKDPKVQETLSSTLADRTMTDVWQWTPDSVTGLLDSDQIRSYLEAGMYAAFTGLSSATNHDYLDDLLVQVMLATHHSCLETKLLWIELCQSAQKDPKDVVEQHIDTILKKTFDKIEYSADRQLQPIGAAALRAVTSIAFVTSAAIPEIVGQIQSDLTCSSLSYDMNRIGIWHNSSDQLFKDVLRPSTSLLTIDKIMKQWSAEQWAQHTQEQIKSRKPLSTKLTKDEDSQLNSQKQNESATKASLTEDIQRLYRGLGIVASLNQPFLDTDKWFAPVIQCLVSRIFTITRPYVGSIVQDTFLSCSTRVRRLGVDNRVLGTATCAILLEWEQNQRLELVNRVLYKLRFESEKEPFDLESFVYAQPLIIEVLNSSGSPNLSRSGCRTDDQVEEQLFLAFEFLNHNLDLFTDPQLRRLEIISACINVLDHRPSQSAEVKSTLQGIFERLAVNVLEADLEFICANMCSSNANVRNALMSAADTLDLSGLKFSPELWLVMHDEDEQNAELATTLFQGNALVLGSDLRDVTLTYLTNQTPFVHRCASRALAHTFEYTPQGMTELLTALSGLYWKAAARDPLSYDRFGQVVQQKVKPDTTSSAREAVAWSIIELSTLEQFTRDHVTFAISFLFGRQPDDTAIPLTDKSSSVRQSMLDAGNAVIRSHGQHAVESVLPLLESALDDHGNTEEADWTRESAVILYGAAASYLAPGDSRIPQVIERLIRTLSTPSETVQLAIADRLADLMRSAKTNEKQYLHELICLLTDGQSYARRRGAAYGLAGVVRGCGVTVLQTEQIMETLQQGIHNKRNAKARQGSLLAYECFASILGNLWEPYIESIIPLLLITFADTDADVRRATQDTARVIMSKISGYGVQSILPSLLSGLEDHQWRSKKGSVELIGAMAYCAPKQLSTSLPTIIPRLNEVLTDSHAQVRAAGNESLTRFGQVIKNPEVQQLVPTLLKALSNPNQFTEEALDRLLKTSFLHYIDSPSLSILIPILRRGMQERAAGTKKKSSKIFGLLASLTSPNDLIPHLASLMPCLRNVLVDTVPDVRATAAKALGSLVEKLGERSFPELVEDLLAILNSDVASTDRQGAAQGLSEVLSGLGLERLEDVLPRILKDARHRLAYVREGFISLLIYLPATFGARFAPYLAKCISPILTGLADDSEFVREASLRAGKIMIANYAAKSVDLMLPELERGMFHEAWRIRVSSLQLVGDLLFKVCGIASKSKNDEEDEDEEVATEAQRNALLEALGQNRRDRILSSLYICRFDAFALVRTSAINVWKTLVANTPKTLKDILPTLIEIIIQSLSIRETEKRAVYVETLGDLMRKLGKDLLTHLLPAFENGLRASVADRIGVCVAITEIVKSASPEQISELEERLVSAVKVVLIDPDEEVRLAANDSFETLQAQFGPKIIDRVLPDLLALLQAGEKAEEALEALKGLMQSRSHTILPILLPGLLVRPMTSFNLQAISSLVRVAGPALTRRLSSLLTTILDAEVAGEATDTASTTFDTILISVPDNAESVAAVMNVMLDLCKHQDFRKRSRACKHLAALFAESKLDYSRYVSDWLRVLLALLADRDSTVVESAWTAQDALTKSLRKEQMPSLVASLRRALQNSCVAGVNLPGFSLPKGLGAVLPILLQGLLYGSAEQREDSALGLADVISRTDENSLKVFVTQITGPLIRIIGERSASEIKSAILVTLRLLIQKIPASLRPFLPQLQRTFTKSLADVNDLVRKRAAAALGDLITLQTARIDPLIVELINGSRSDESSTSAAMLAALFEVISKAGSVMSEASKTNVISLVKDLSTSDGSSKAADLLGVLFKTINSEAQSRELLTNVVLIEPPTLFSINALNGLLLNSTTKIIEVHASEDVASYLATTILSQQPEIAERSVVAAGKYLLNEELSQHPHDGTLILALTECVERCPSNSSDSTRLSLIVLRAVSKHSHIVRAHIGRVGLAVFANVRSPILPIKLAAEATFVSIFQMVDDQDKLLTPFIEQLPASKARSISEYAKRVASKMATAESERRAAGIQDRDDDIQEIMGIFEPEQVDT